VHGMVGGGGGPVHEVWGVDGVLRMGVLLVLFSLHDGLGIGCGA
jgi:hypothetical protein